MESNGRIEVQDDAPHLDQDELEREADEVVRQSLPSFAGIDAEELEQHIDTETDWLVDYVFSSDQPTVFGAASKATKTTQLVDLSVALATGSPWLDAFNVSRRRKVLFITGESNYRAISKRIKRALNVRMIDNQTMDWSDVSGWLRVEAIEFPTLPSLLHRMGIEADIQEHGIEVVIIDPLYRGLGTLDSHRMAEMGDAIIGFTKACQPASVIISHHIIKSAAREFGPPTLESLSGAGLAESCGNWWLIGRNDPYQYDRRHDLTVTYGGRDEQAGIKRIVFNEEDWTFEITTGQDIKNQKEQEQQERKRKAELGKLNAARVEVIDKLEKRKTPVAKRWIEERSTHPQNAIRKAIAALFDDGTIVSGDYTDGCNRTREDGVILAVNVPPASDKPTPQPTKKRAKKRNQQLVK